MPMLRFRRILPAPAVYHANVTRVGPGETTLAHTHDFVEFFQVLQGAGTHHWNGRRIALQAGDLAFIRPHDCHWYSTSRREALVFLNIAVAGAWWRRFAALLELRPTDETFRLAPTPFHIRLAPPHSADMEALLLSLFRRRDDHGLIRACLRLVATFDRPAPAHAADVPEWLVDLRRQMERPELLARGIDYWQQHSGRSKEHFSRTCRRYFGMPPTELLNRLRIEHVKLRLRTSTEKLAALALEAGFENLGYFYRVFRQHAGCSPHRWRRSQTDLAVPRAGESLRPVMSDSAGKCPPRERCV